MSALYFHHKSAQEIAESSSLILFTGSVDNRIRMFNLNAPTRGAGKPDILFEGHVSVPRGLAVSNDGRWLISGGRDSVILLWDLKNKGKGHVTNPTKTIPATERVEALGIIPNLVGSSTKTSSLRIYTGGEQGIIKVWDVWEGMTIAKMSPQHVVEDEQREIVHMQYVCPFLLPFSPFLSICLDISRPLRYSSPYTPTTTSYFTPSYPTNSQDSLLASTTKSLMPFF